MERLPLDDELLTPALNVSIVDTETTGLDPSADEVIGLAILCLRVDRASGRVVGVVGDTCQWQEPARMSLEAQSITRCDEATSKGSASIGTPSKHFLQ